MTPDDAVRARRRLTNKFIAAHQAERLRPFFAASALVVTGDGSRIEGADAGDGEGECGAQALGEGETHSEPGKGAGAEDDADALEVVEGEAGGGEGLLDQRGQALLMAAGHGFRRRGEHPIAVQHRRLAGAEAGVDA